jgi:hypothetical protein
MSKWDEIRRLAADLQRIQLGDSVKKLVYTCFVNFSNLIAGYQLKIVLKL